jgi:hypothetical protein
MADFVIWGSTYSEGSCVIGRNPEGFPEPGLLIRGVKLFDQWPADVTYRMNPEYPKDIRLTDSLYGPINRVISLPLRRRLAELVAADESEFLPVTIVNHKGRVASKEYFFLNPVGCLDCIDVDKSGIVWNAIDSDRISRARHLTLRAEAVPSTSNLFRPAYMVGVTLLRRAVSDRLAADGFSGLKFSELGRYPA